MRILLVEDDAMVGESLTRALLQNDHVVDWLRDGETAEAALSTHTFDIVLLDLGLPNRSGLDVLKQLRTRNNDVPVIILTAREAISERVAGLDAGADDYLVKPFALDELEARVRAVQRRHWSNKKTQLECGALTLDPTTHQVTLHGKPVALSVREYQILHLLMRRPGAIVSRDKFEEQLYSWGEEIESNAIEVYIHRLRQKLNPKLIHTVRGLGYQVVAE